MGCIYRLKNSPFWWIKYIGADGKPQYESSKTSDHNAAKDMLKLREGKLAEGVPVTAAVGRLKLKDAAADLVNDFRVNNRKSLDEVERRLRLHLLPYFGRLRMAEIDTALVRRYIAKRQSDRIVVQQARAIAHRDGRREELPEVTKPVSSAEINRELQILKRCFNLAKEEGRLLHVPHIPTLEENNARKGFLDAAQLQDVLAFLPVELRPVIQFAYITGWRIASEVLPLTWSRVDFDAGEVRLDTSKNGAGRVLPMNDDLRALLKSQQREHERLMKGGHLVPWVFVRMVAEGRGGPKKPQRIISFNKAWKAACAQAGHPGIVPHDLRRSAVRNMIRRGVPEGIAMRLVGHKTRAMLDRYNIIDGRDLREAVDRLTGVAGNVEVKPRVKQAAVVGIGVRRSRQNPE
jgi:integrase